MSYRRMVLSLLDVCVFVRDTFREIALYSLQQHTQQRPSSFRSVVFDPYQFLTKLVEDINLGDQRPKRYGGSPEATMQLLVQEGMAPEMARWIYHQAWQLVADHIAACWPEVTMGADSPWEFTLSLGMDLEVTIYLEEPATVRTPDGTVMDDIYASRAAPEVPSVPTAVPGSRPSQNLSWLIEEPAVSQVSGVELHTRYEHEYGRPVPYVHPVSERSYGQRRL